MTRKSSYLLFNFTNQNIFKKIGRGILFTSCEAIIYGEGRIFDAQTLEPLDSVFCDNGRNETYSDSTGFYDLPYGLVGCSFGCKDYEFSYSKSGYQTLKVDNPYEQDIFLWKE